MHVAIKEASNDKITKVMENLYAELLEDGDKVTIHYLNGDIVCYECQPEWVNLDTNFVLIPEI